MSQIQRQPIDDLRTSVVEEAKTWIGTPYHHFAHVKGHGVDCGWLLIEVYSSCGVIERFDPGYYAPDWMLHRGEELYLSMVERYARPIQIPKPGDLAIWRFGRCFSHGAIVVDWPKIIHAYIREEAVVYGDGSAGIFARLPVKFYTPFPEEGQ